MKLKYYLRGIGLGIIFATIVLIVSAAVHNNHLSKEKIIEEALKLGMVMPESESEKMDIDSQAEDTQQNESEMSSEIETDAQTQQQESSDTQQEIETQVSSESQQQGAEGQGVEIVLTQDTYASSYGEKVIVNKSPDNPTREILMTVKTGATSEDVSEVLRQCGYIDDELEFNEFMRVNSYAKRIRTGEKIIPAGSTHADIARILMEKNN